MSKYSQRFFLESGIIDFKQSLPQSKLSGLRKRILLLGVELGIKDEINKPRKSLRIKFMLFERRN